MSDKVKQLAPQIWSEIQKANKILLHCHPGPDGDSIGGVLGMMHVLQNIGKEVTVIMGDSEPPPTLACLPGFGQIVINNWSELDLSKYDLFISQDSSDLSQITKKVEVKFPIHMRVVVIDHHGTNRGYGHVNFIEPAYPSVCQMDYELCKQWNTEITSKAAACFFIGIYTDTGGFKYPATTADTFKAATELVLICPEFYKIVFELENNYEPEQIKFIGLSLSRIELYFEGKVAISAVPYEELKKLGIQEVHTEKAQVSEMLKSVKGWEIGVRFTEAKPGVVSLSIRTRDAKKYDVSKIAVATGFGGGHMYAAGATLTMPFNQAKKHLLKTIQKVYPELGQP